MQDYSDHEIVTFIVHQLAKAFPTPPIPAQIQQGIDNGTIRVP